TSVNLTSGSGAIGTVALVTPNVTANTTGNVTLTDTQAITGNGVSTGANFSLTDSAAGGITTTNTITATGTLGLVDSAASAPIALGASVSGTVDTITATGSGTVTQSAGTVTGSTSVTLASGSGAIGTIALVTPNVT